MLAFVFCCSAKSDVADVCIVPSFLCFLDYKTLLVFVYFLSTNTFFEAKVQSVNELASTADQKVLQSDTGRFKETGVLFGKLLLAFDAFIFMFLFAELLTRVDIVLQSPSEQTSISK